MPNSKYDSSKYRPRPVIYAVLWLVLLSYVDFAWTADTAVDETQIIAKDEEANSPSEATQTSVKTPAPERIRKQQRSLLANVDLGPEAAWVEGANEPFLGFWQDETSGKPSGALLLLHDAENSPLWPETLLNLQIHLPKFGWATLSIELLPLPKPTVPPRKKPAPQPVASEKKEDPTSAVVDETNVVHQEPAEVTAETTPSPDTLLPPAQSVDEVLQLNQQRIGAGMAYLNKKGQYNIVVLGVGFGAFQSLHYANKTSAPPEIASEVNPNKKAVIERAIRALITIDMRSNYARVPSSIEDLLVQPSIPLLEINTDVDLEIKNEFQQRKQLSKKNHYLLYRQRLLTPRKGILYQFEETELSKAVRGFLKRYASGVEL